MSAPRSSRSRRRRSTIATLGFLAPIVAYVVWSSLNETAFECEVCLRFGGRETCRTVTAATEGEGLRAAVDNACGILTSGVTNTLRCTRTPPSSASCRPL